MVWIDDEDEIWEPQEVGETLRGVIISVEEHPHYGKSWVIERIGKPKIMTPRHRVLQDRIERNLYKIGDRISIIYKGEKPTNKGNPVQIYKTQHWDDEKEIS